MIVIASEGGVPVVAASNPTDVFAMDDLRTIIGRNFIVVSPAEHRSPPTSDSAFNSGGDASDMAMEASLGFDGLGAGKRRRRHSGGHRRGTHRSLCEPAHPAGSERAAPSDIHIEPTERELRIRYRIDGVLHDVSTAPRTIAPAVITSVEGDGRYEHRGASESRRTEGSPSTSEAKGSISGWPHCRPSMAKRWSCGCWTSQASSSASPIWGLKNTS